MIHYRPYLNCDPPAITEIWRTHPPMRGLVQSMSPDVLERTILSKQYFDRFGLILAFDDERPIGFVHAGFGPSEDFSRLSKRRGVTCLLMVVPRDDREQVAGELLARSEKYLTEHGATELFAGGCFPLNPFYLGLYGGSELPGVLDSDQFQQTVFRAAGYAEHQRFRLLQKSLVGYRPLIDRTQMQIRRRCLVQATIDPPPANWWEACTIGQSLRMRFELHERVSNERIGRATFWDMEPMASNRGVHAMGLLDVEIAEPHRRQGLATFLVGEALRQIQSNGITVTETQFAANRDDVAGLFAKLGFETVDHGVSLRRSERPA